MITFGKLEGSVKDGGKSIDVFVDGARVGMIEVHYNARHIGATRRVEHYATHVEGYVFDTEITPIEVVDGRLAPAITAAKNAIRLAEDGFDI